MASPSRQGSGIGAIRGAAENGDWWPHVHVQIITDMLDVPCNFNGVAPCESAPDLAQHFA
jgi:hypothetical protein